MTTPVALSQDLPDPKRVTVPLVPVDPALTRSNPLPTVLTVNDTRLVIEEDKASKSFIYKTLDRRTGEVLQQFPRESLLKLGHQADYAPGQVLRAST